MQEVQVMQKVTVLIKDDRGAITILTVILMAAFVGILALIIDLGHLHTVQGELRNAADACALRGARAFYADVKPYQEPADNLNAIAQAKATVGVNDSDNTPLQEIVDNSDQTDIQTGVWDFENRQWLYNDGTGQPVFTWPPNVADWGKVIGPGISLRVRKEGGVNAGPVSMTLARIFGMSTVNVNTPATAALSPLGELGEDNWEENGEPPPLQIGDAYAKLGTGTLTLHPDNDDAGGWHSYYGLGNPNKPVLEDLIWGKTKSGADVEIPTIDLTKPAQSDIERLNGVIADLFQPNNDRSLINRWLQITGAEIDDVGNLTTPVQTPWEVRLPVTSSDGPYVGTAEVLGFVTCTIDRVYPPNYPDPTKKLCIDVSISSIPEVSSGHGGGKYYGIIALDPKLVK
jgi:hypothetical protein